MECGGQERQNEKENDHLGMDRFTLIENKSCKQVYPDPGPVFRKNRADRASLYANAFTMAFRVGLGRIPLDVFSGSGW